MISLYAICHLPLFQDGGNGLQQTDAMSMACTREVLTWREEFSHFTISDATSDP